MRDGYHLDLMLSFLARAVLYAGIIGFGAFALGGCSADKDRSRQIDLGVKGAYTLPPGDAAGTRNQVPQGGIDEKSGSTPTKSVD